MLPGELRKGDRLTAEWINRLVREEVARTLKAGPGVRISRTPSGSTISATGHSARAAAPVEFDFPWRVTVAPILDSRGEPTGSATVSVGNAIAANMVTGKVWLGSGSGLDIPGAGTLSIRLPSSVSASGTVVVRLPLTMPKAQSSPDYYSVRYVADGDTPDDPGDPPDWVAVPVARVRKSPSGEWSVVQILYGALPYYLVVDEEI